MKFAPNFPKHEFEASQTAARKGLDNELKGEALENASKLSWWLQELRNKINRHHRRESESRELPVIITSGYRGPALNEAIGGSKTSQHMKGQAVDIHVPGMTARELVDFIVKHMTGYDQMIEEFASWTHVSVTPNPRGEVLIARKRGGKVTYSHLAQNDK
ncbi:D-Ala-D-Ala carboxypeptidase family metallohydrolase [Cobetia sp. SIMBA_158]|uniref:D-Ala-D-Ala carboxypeptidase family metallohydrolase n=1 Tax=Cobetia sp. SIMBA_158 TaxID=3081617 RepID=UPI00397F73F9